MKRYRIGGTPLALALAVFLCPIGLSTAPTYAATQPTTAHKPPSEPFVRGQPTIWRGDHYSVKGKRTDLVRRVDQIAVQLRADAASDASSQLTRPGGALAGFRQLRGLRTGLTVFEHPELASEATQSASRAYDRITQALARLSAEPAVAWSTPVFVNTRLGSYAVATDEVLVRLKDGVSAQDFFADTRFAGVRRAASSDAFVATVKAGAGEAVLSVANALQADPRVVWIEPNFFQERKRQFTPNDPLFADQWHLDNTGQVGGTAGADAHLKEAWDLVPSGAADIVIAIVDDGPDMNHPDLAVFQSPGEIPGNGIDDDGNGYIDDTIGWDFTSGGLGDNNPGATTPEDFHATPVAGVAAARGNNATGVTGAAFGARIFASRIFGDDGFATDDANIGSALAYAAGRGRAAGDNDWHGADITNNSWGGGEQASAIDDALAWAADHGRNGLGTANFFATGNSGAPFISYPASMSGIFDSVIAVGASTNRDKRSDYSQYGPQIDFVAPSNGGTLAITSTDRLGGNGLNGLPDLDYTNNFGGTSSATPLAAGVGGLLLGADPSLTIADLRTLLRGTADKIGPLTYDNGFNVQYGFGRINAAAAVAAIGHAQVRVSLDGVDIQHAVGVSLPAVAGEPLPITFTVTALGSETLLVSGLALSGSPAFTVEEPVADTALELGESTTFSLGFVADSAGSYDTVVTLHSNDDDTPAFSIPVHVDVAAVSIGGSVFEDWNGNGEADPGDAPRSGVAVYLDANANSVRDLSTPQSVSSPANLGLVFGQAPVQTTHTMQVSGLPERLDRVTVTIDAEHVWIGDISVRLIAPDGQAIVLAHQPGGANNGGQNFEGTTFDDEAQGFIDDAFAPYSGDFVPLEPLSTFTGIDPNGDWTLELTDLYPSLDDGALQHWSLTLHTGAELTSVTNVEGRYRFLSLPPTVHRVGTETPSWLTTAPAAAFHAVEVFGSENNDDVDFGQVRRQSIYGRVYSDVDKDGAFGDTDLPMSGETVFLDANADGQLAEPAFVSFIRTPAIAMPDADQTGVSDSIDIPATGLIRSVQKVTVSVDITHTFAADLQLILTAPDGKTVQLTQHNGGSGANFSGTVFDDEAATSIADASATDAPFTGAFRPIEPLSTLNGSDIAGIWTLTVIDVWGGDVGTFDSWTLDVDYQDEPSVMTNAFGNYRFDVIAGNYDVRMLVPQGLSLTTPLSGQHLVAISDDNVSLNRDFGLGTPNQAPIGFSLPDVTVPIGSAVNIATMPAFTDPDGNTLTYAADGLPGVLTINTVTGIIGGVVEVTDLGDHVVTVTATDTEGADVSLDFLLRVVDTPIFADGFED